MSNYIIKDGELMHYGVPGMRWGHRKAQPTGGGKSRRKSSKKAKQEAIRKMSDDELRKKINRIEMEKKYDKLTKRESVVGNIGKKVLTTAVTSVATAIVVKSLNKGLGTIGSKMKGSGADAVKDILKNKGSVNIDTSGLNDMFKDMK